MLSTKLNAGLVLSYQASRYILTEDEMSEYTLDFIGAAMSDAYKSKWTSDFERRILLQALEICARQKMLLSQRYVENGTHPVDSRTFLEVARGSLSLSSDPGFFRVPYGE